MWPTLKPKFTSVVTIDNQDETVALVHFESFITCEVSIGVYKLISSFVWI